MELTAETPFAINMATNEGNPFGGIFDIEGVQSNGAETENFLDMSPADALRNAFSTAGENRRMSVASGLVSGAINLITGIGKTVIVILSQAVKMAVFKFAIELCAMGIKNLVEGMQGMDLKAPNIDTQGVFYNFGGAAPAQQTTQQSTGTNSGRYESNPFGNPFPATSMPW